MYWRNVPFLILSEEINSEGENIYACLIPSNWQSWDSHPGFKISNPIVALKGDSALGKFT